MEMTFPHSATRQTADKRSRAHDTIVATIVARQNDSLTAQAMATAKGLRRTLTAVSDDAVDQRIHYFGSQPVNGKAPGGSFLDAATKDDRAEFKVYQADSANIKALGLPDGGTGQQTDHVGHGASRTI